MLASQVVSSLGAMGGARAVDRTELKTVMVVVGVFPLSWPGPLLPMLTVPVFVMVGVVELGVLVGVLVGVGVLGVDD